MSKNKKGFTIIEVVLVLAIAGLIFLMVFIALPALQRSQRNTQREDDLSRFLTAANDYQTNNNGKTPFKNNNNTYSVDTKFVKRYIDDECNTKDGINYSDCGAQFTDPDGTIYSMKHIAQISKQTDVASVDSSVQNIDWPNLHTVMAYTNASCGDEGVAEKGTGNRQYAVFYVLEGGAISCNDNH
ncbi:MAG: type II secretion system GspH family protein [Candidatus Saccharibacteria bacterium]|nr:type II secretion system GspH family protein [Candidatus Saccharibacteria bacterium]